MKKSRKILTGIMVACLLTFGVHKSKALVGYICGGVVIVAGGYIVWKLKKFCERHLPPPPPPPPAPPATNSPPPTVTNAPPRRAAIEMEVDESSYSAYDIAAYSATNGWNDPNGEPWESMFILHLETSTNCITWQSHSITGWCTKWWQLIAVGTNVWMQRPGTCLETGTDQQRFFRVRQ